MNAQIFPTGGDPGSALAGGAAYGGEGKITGREMLVRGIEATSRIVADMEALYNIESTR